MANRVILCAFEIDLIPFRRPTDQEQAVKRFGADKQTDGPIRSVITAQFIYHHGGQNTPLCQEATTPIGVEASYFRGQDLQM